MNFDTTHGVKPRLRLPAQGEVQVHVGSQQIGCERLRVTRSELHVDRAARHEQAYGTARRNSSWPGVRGETCDPQSVAGRFNQGVDLGQVCAEGIVLQLASSKPHVAAYPRRVERTADADVHADLTFRAASVDFQKRIGGGRVDTAVG